MTGFSIEKDDGQKIEVSEEVFMSFSRLSSNLKAKTKNITEVFVEYVMEKEGIASREAALDFIFEKVNFKAPAYLSDFIVGKKP